MKFLITSFVSAVLISVALAGCSAGAADAKPSLTPDEGDNMYITLTRAAYDLKGDDDSIIEIGRGLCKQLDEGVTVPEYVAGSMANGAPRDMVEALIAAAPGAYCPEHSKEVTAYLSGE